MVLVHGLGASGRYWRWVAEELAGEVTLIAPDLLGFGRSPWPKIEYSVDTHLDALDSVLDRLEPGDEPLSLAGHSLGTILTLAWAARHPGRFAGLVQRHAGFDGSRTSTLPIISTHHLQGGGVLVGHAAYNWGSRTHGLPPANCSVTH